MAGGHAGGFGAWCWLRRAPRKGVSATFGHQGSADHHCNIPESTQEILGFQNLPEDAPDGANLRSWSESESAPFL